MNLAEIVDHLDETLRVHDYDDADIAANGLQVGPDPDGDAARDFQVNHVAFAVDAAIETIERAADAGADLLVVHHGLYHDGTDRLVGRQYRRTAPLVENDLALYTAHLPLDGHQEFGNAAGVADELDLADRAPFGEVGGEPVGQRGVAEPATTVEEMAGTLDAELDHGGEGVQVLDFGPETVEEVAIVTGSGVDFIDAAVEAGADALVTGEGKQHAYHQAKEAGIHLLLGGHYGTETFGLRSLEESVFEEEWGLETTFVDAPTGL